MKSITLRWQTTMPLGTPVEPEVKLMYRGSVSTARIRRASSRERSASVCSSSSTVTMEGPLKISRAEDSRALVVTMTAGSSTEAIWASREGGSSVFRAE